MQIPQPGILNTKIPKPCNMRHILAVELLGQMPAPSKNDDHLDFSLIE